MCASVAGAWLLLGSVEGALSKSCWSSCREMVCGWKGGQSGTPRQALNPKQRQLGVHSAWQ